MNLSDNSTFLLDWFCSGNFGIEATGNNISPDSIINDVTNHLSIAINHTCALQHSPISSFM